MKKVELLAPAGDMERLITAERYGADAVYFGENSFGLRTGVGFDIESIKKGIDYLHEHNKSAYITVNIIPHNDDLRGMDKYLSALDSYAADAMIVSDPGVITMAKEFAPHVKIHLSTQANTVNYKSALFWYNQGIKRIVMAREVSLNEIKEIRHHMPDDFEIEAFIHGAMCISYSGRCLLSMYTTQRDANKGECAHPCRWEYTLIEKSRPGEYFDINEDDRGTYILNSKDLCMIEYIPYMIESGIDSFKVEGRNKTAYYVATVIGAYRKAIDRYLDNPASYEFDPASIDELKKASYREFTTAFYLGKPKDSQNYNSSSYIRKYDFVGKVLSYDDKTQYAVIEQRNRVCAGDKVEIISPYKNFIEFTINEMFDEDGNRITCAPHPKQKFRIKIPHDLKPYDMLRRKK